MLSTEQNDQGTSGGLRDPFWNELEVEKFYQRSDAYDIKPSRIAGCGIVAARSIKAGEKVGLVWVKDPQSYKAAEFADFVPRHFTPWFGRAINHCAFHSNSRLEEDKEGSVWTIAKRDISRGEEITGDYHEAHQQFPYLVEDAPAEWDGKGC